MPTSRVRQQKTHASGTASLPHDTFTTATPLLDSAGDASTARVTGGTVSTAQWYTRGEASRTPSGMTATTSSV